MTYSSIRDSVEVTGLRLSPWEIELILDMSVALRIAVEKEGEKKPELTMADLDDMLSEASRK